MREISQRPSAIPTETYKRLMDSWRESVCEHGYGKSYVQCVQTAPNEWQHPSVVYPTI